MEKMRKRRVVSPFPEEIIEEILYQLPPKSLLRFKSVCRTWRSRISSPYFIKTHLTKSSDFAHQNLILNIHRHPLYSLRSYSLQSFLDCQPHDVVSSFPDYVAENPSDGPFRICGSRNGLILVTTHSYGSLCLWNPSIRKARTIPHLHGRPFMSYGFVYDESADDYRIVCISKPSHPAGRFYETHIYSLRNDSWKKIENFYKGASPIEDSGKFVNGRLHWIAQYRDINGSSVRDIVCLDLGKEEEEMRYEVVTKPDCLLSQSFCCPQWLRVLGGNLGFVCYMNNEFDMNVWVMKEYRVRDSWVKILHIPNPMDLWGLDDTAKFHKMCLRVLSVHDGDGVFACESTLIFYDGQNKLRNIKADVVRDSLQAYVYVDSLVWPFCKGDQPPRLATDSLPSWLKMLIN